MSLFNGQLTSAGFSRVAMTDIQNALNAIWKAAWGVDCDLDPRSPDGQIIGVLTEMFHDLNGIAADTINLANPNGATKAMLSNLLYLTGIARNGTSFPSAPCTVAGTPGTVVPTTFTVQSTVDGTQWKPNAAITIGGGGLGFGTLVCTTTGPLPSGGPPTDGALTHIITVMTGVDSITNAIGVPGANVELDSNARVRRQQSTAIASQATTDGLQAALKALPGVVDAVVWENNTSSALAIQSGVGAAINANTVRCIVQVTGGGAADPTLTSSSDDPVANRIYTLKGNGCGTQGAVSKAPLDDVGVAHDIMYDLASPLEVWVMVQVATRVNWPTDGEAQIKVAIASWASGSNATTGKPNIPISGNDHGKLSWTDVLASFLNVVPGFDFVALMFSIDAGSTWTTSPASLSVPFGSFVSITNVMVVSS